MKRRTHSPDPNAVMVRCFIHGGDFQFGPHRYAGKHIPRYQITVCETCYQANWDGWAPHYEARILGHLATQGLPVPERNTDGLLPRE